MNVKQMIKTRLKEKGCDALANREVPCGCQVSDLAPCDSKNILDCEAGHWRACPGEQFMGLAFVGPRWRFDNRLFHCVNDHTFTGAKIVMVADHGEPRMKCPDCGAEIKEFEEL